jgi:hypothetical protein
VSLTFKLGDKIVTEQSLIMSAPKKKAKKSDLKTVKDRDAAKVSMGFVVEGYSPSYWSGRLIDYGIALKGKKHPGTLEEYEPAWRSKNKPKRARSKPYEIESSADQCAEMLRDAGWRHVAVRELLKG